MDHPGKLLRALRLKRGLSQKRLAEQAQVTTRAMQYWESNHQKPRDVELESLLTALAATPQERGQIYAGFTDQRSVRLVGSREWMDNISTSKLGPLPGIGDLLRALRHRGGWTQEGLAQVMGINRATVIRWESTQTLPSDDDMDRLSLLLNASPTEHTALKNRRLSFSSWSPQLTLEECWEQWENLALLRAGNSALLPLADLHMLALKRQLRFLLHQSSEALRLLAKIEVHHSWWLYMQGRIVESSAGNRRALEWVQGTFAPENFWTNALNLLSAHAAQGVRGSEKAVRLLHPWLRHFPPSIQYWVLCDMAFYSGRANRAEDATHFLQRAQQVLPRRLQGGEEERGYFHTFRLTKARVLLSTGKPVEAMEWLPPFVPVGDGGVHELLVWAEAYLAAGERNMATGCLNEAKVLLGRMPLPQRQIKLDQLARQL